MQCTRSLTPPAAMTSARRVPACLPPLQRVPGLPSRLGGQHPVWAAWPGVRHARRRQQQRRRGRRRGRGELGGSARLLAGAARLAERRRQLAEQQPGSCAADQAGGCAAVTAGSAAAGPHGNRNSCVRSCTFRGWGQRRCRGVRCSSGRTERASSGGSSTTRSSAAAAGGGAVGAQHPHCYPGGAGCGAERRLAGAVLRAAAGLPAGHGGPLARHALGAGALSGAHPTRA